MEQILIIIGIVIIYSSIVYFGSKAIGNQIYRYQKLNKDIEFLEKLENDQINDIRMNNRRFLDKLPDKWEPLSK
jgi:hypothetical protein